MAVQEDIMLQDTWTYRFHDPDNSDWTLSSYVRLCDVSSINDMWDVQNDISTKLVDGMFFVMREHVFPCWDDPFNIKGGCLSIKVMKSELLSFWESLLIGVLGEMMLPDTPIKGCNHAEWVTQINGISTSPKNHFCIVKIWLRQDLNYVAGDFKLPKNHYGEVIYKSNSSMIQTSSVIKPIEKSSKV